MHRGEDVPGKRLTHEIGQQLDDLSVGDFDARIALLTSEIERLELAKRHKQAALDEAGSVFRTVQLKP